MKRILSLFLFLFCLSAFSQDWYVSLDGTGNGINGWVDATNDLQAAISACASNYTVFVSNGVYVTNISIGSGIKLQSIHNDPSEVTLDGNFAGRVADMADTTSWVIGMTIQNGYVYGEYGSGVRNGSVSNCVITQSTGGSGAANCDIYNSTISYCSGDFGGGVHFCSTYDSSILNNSALWGGGGVEYGISSNCIIQGNVVYNGGAPSAGSGGGGEGGKYYDCQILDNSAMMGGGLTLGQYDGTESATRCLIKGNVSSNILYPNEGGGGVLGYNTTLYQCTISNNTALLNGGGVSAYQNDQDSYIVSLIGCTVVQNYAQSGAGCFGSGIVLSNSVVSNNTASVCGGGLMSYGSPNVMKLTQSVVANNTGPYGGGVYGDLSYTRPVITNCILCGNLANGYDGGGAYNCDVNNSIISNNSSYGSGGGVYGCYVSVSTCSVNTASVNGGGGYNSSFSNCKISDNATPSGFAAGVYDDVGSSLYGCLIQSNISAGVAGGVYGYTNVIGCRIIGNTATTDGGGAYNAGLYSCLLWQNVAAQYGGGMFGSTGFNCTVVSNYAGAGGGGWGSTFLNSISKGNNILDDFSAGGSNYFSCNLAFTNEGSGSIHRPPVFVDEIGGNFHLNPWSPCRSRGDTNIFDMSAAVDADGNPRIYTENGTNFVDIGCYQFQSGYTPINWYVATNGTGRGTNGWPDATNDLIQAINACASGYTVFVSNGNYQTNIHIWEGVTVKGRTGLPSDVRICDGCMDSSHRIVTMYSNSYLVGVMVTNGNNGYGEAADQYSLADPFWGAGVLGGTISNCIISHNTSQYGGGTYSSILYNSLVLSNSAYWDGAGCYYGTNYNCTIFGNTIFVGDAGSGVYGCTMINSVSWKNFNSYRQLILSDDSAGVGTNWCSFGVGAGYGPYSTTHSLDATYLDPLFVDEANGNYQLQATSICRSTGDTNAWPMAGTKDLVGNYRIYSAGNNSVSMGCFEYGSQPNYPPVYGPLNIYGFLVNRLPAP